MHIGTDDRRCVARSISRSAPGLAAVLVLSGTAAAFASGPSHADCLATSDPYHLREMRVSTFKPSAQEQAVVCALGGGDQGQWLAAWSSRRQNAGRSGVFLQRLTAEGVAVGTETPLAVWNQTHQRSPALARTSAGAVAAWQSWGQDGDQGAIIARRFVLGPDAVSGMEADASDKGSLVGGDEVLVNQTVAGDQTRPVVAVSPDGHVLIAWTSQTPDGGSTVMARAFDANLDAIGDEINLLGEPAGSTAASAWVSLTALTPAVLGDDGAVFAAAIAVTTSGEPDGVRLIRLDAHGRSIGQPTLVGIDGSGAAIEPVIASAPFGLVASWATPDADRSTYRVAVQRLGRDGSELGPVFYVGEPTDGLQNAPAIEVGLDGSFLVVYNQDDTDSTGVRARWFDAAGFPSSAPFSLHASPRGERRVELTAAPRTAAMGADFIAVAWSGESASADRHSANVTLLSVSPPAPGTIAGVTPGMAPAPFSRDQLAAESSAAEPHIPPTFDRAAIERGQRTIDLTGRSIGFDAVINTGWTPPDPHMAVGPDYVVVMTNGAIAYYRKSDGVKTFQDEIEDSFGFWGSVGATGFVFDPEVLYDELSGRFFAMAAEAYAPPSQTRSYVLIAVSDDSDPNGTWYKYRFDTTALSGNLFDSPNIAVSDDVVLVTGDGFGITSNYPVYTLRKSDLLAGIPTSFVRSTTLTTSTQSAGIPPVYFDSPPALYMLEHQEGSNRTQVRLIALTNPFTGPNFTTINLTVPTYSNPGNPVQQGTTTRPTAFDARFWSVAYRNGSLWGTHHVDSVVKARWYEIAMNGWPASGNNPSLVQTGVINPGANINTSFSSITVSPAGHAAVCYAFSSASHFLSMATSHRLYCDPPSTMRPAVIHKASNAAYNTTRWGDYSAVQVDPVDGRTFWAVHEYAISGSWRTWVQRIDPDYCPYECPADFDGSGFVDNEDFNAFVLAFELGGDDADFDGSGFVDLEDYVAFILAFEAGC